MTKAEMIAGLASNWHVTKKQAEVYLGDVLFTIGSAISDYKRVALVGFGVFSVRERKARTVRNPQTGDMMKVKKSTTVGFRPSKQLRARV